MKVNLIDSVIQSLFEGCNSVTKAVSSTEFELGEICFSKNHSCLTGMAIIIGIYGDFRGHVCFTLKSTLAKKLASSIMGEDEIPDEYLNGAFAELCNMIMGSGMGLLAEKGINVDITPPAIITGQDIGLSVEKLQMVRLPLTINGINEMNMCIAISINE